MLGTSGVQVPGAGAGAGAGADTTGVRGRSQAASSTSSAVHVAGAAAAGRAVVGRGRPRGLAPGATTLDPLHARASRIMTRRAVVHLGELKVAALRTGARGRLDVSRARRRLPISRGRHAGIGGRALRSIGRAARGNPAAPLRAGARSTA